MGVWMTISVCALMVSNIVRPGWGVTVTASAAWGLSLLSMMGVRRGMETGIGLQGAMQVLGAWAVQWASYRWLGHISHMTAHMSLLSFDVVVLWTVVSRWRGQAASGGFVLVCGTLSPLVGISLSPHGFSVGEAVVMTAIAASWSQAYQGLESCLRHRIVSHKRLTTYPQKEERLKTRALLWAELSALLSLSPFYTDRLGTAYLAWSFALSLIFLLVTGWSLITPMPRAIMSVRIARVLTPFYLAGVFVCMLAYRHIR